jgi:hypothetical protein
MTGAQVFKSIYAQSTGVVFAGRNGLDFWELRLGAVRIPEVSMRIREAQRILDRLEVERVDLLGSTVSEDESFFRNIKIKSLLAAIVQVGLYDRLVKSQRVPDVLIGNSNGDSALLVCAGQITFEQMITTSAALRTLQPRPSVEAVKSTESGLATVSLLPLGNWGGGAGAIANAPGASMPLLPGVSAVHAFDSESSDSLISTLPSLAGVSLTEYRAFVRAEDGGMVEVGQPVMDMKRLVSEVVEHQAVTRFINIGPALAMANSEYEIIGETAGAYEVTIIDSIDLDPMLNWFWKQMRPTLGYAQ